MKEGRRSNICEQDESKGNKTSNRKRREDTKNNINKEVKQKKEREVKGKGN